MCVVRGRSVVQVRARKSRALTRGGHRDMHVDATIPRVGT